MTAEKLIYKKYGERGLEPITDTAIFSAEFKMKNLNKR